MPIGEPHTEVKHKLTTDEQLGRSLVVIPGTRLDFSAHPTDFKVWNEGEHPRANNGRFGNKPGVRENVGTGDKKPKDKKKSAETVSVYHGTVSAVKQKIEKQGIQPASRINRLYPNSYYRGERGKAVYLTTDKSNAKEWGNLAAREYAEREVVKKYGRNISTEEFVSRLTEELARYKVIIVSASVSKDKLKRDSSLIGETSFYHIGPILPQYIKSIKSDVNNIQVFIPILVKEA